MSDKAESDKWIIDDDDSSASSLSQHAASPPMSIQDLSEDLSEDSDLDKLADLRELAQAELEYKKRKAETQVEDKTPRKKKKAPRKKKKAETHVEDKTPRKVLPVRFVRYRSTIIHAIKSLNDHSGSSMIAIQKVLQDQDKKFRPDNWEECWPNDFLLNVLKRGVATGDLIEVNACYKLNPNPEPELEPDQVQVETRTTEMNLQNETRRSVLPIRSTRRKSIPRASKRKPVQALRKKPVV